MQKPTKCFEFPGIYQLLNTQTGKRYVGQAQNISNRIREHLRKRNGVTRSQYSLLYRASNKYGWDLFHWSVLERVDELSKLDEREAFWIKALDTCNKDKGYNIVYDPVTQRGWNHNEETKEKMRTLAIGKFDGTANPFFGKKHSAETKAKIGAANSGRECTDEVRAKLRASRATNGGGRASRKIAQIDINTNEIVAEWESIADVCRSLGASVGSIVGCCKGLRGRKTTKGFKWAYLS